MQLCRILSPPGNLHRSFVLARHQVSSSAFIKSLLAPVFVSSAGKPSAKIPRSTCSLFLLFAVAVYLFIFFLSHDLTNLCASTRRTRLGPTVLLLTTGCLRSGLCHLYIEKFASRYILLLELLAFPLFSHFFSTWEKEIPPGQGRMTTSGTTESLLVKEKRVCRREVFLVRRKRKKERNGHMTALPVHLSPHVQEEHSVHQWPSFWRLNKCGSETARAGEWGILPRVLLRCASKAVAWHLFCAFVILCAVCARKMSCPCVLQQ